MLTDRQTYICINIFLASLGLRMLTTFCLPVCLLEPLQGQDEQLGVVFVGQRREWDGREPPTLQPVDSGGVDGNGFLSGDVGAILSTESATI